MSALGGATCQCRAIAAPAQRAPPVLGQHGVEKDSEGETRTVFEGRRLYYAVKRTKEQLLLRLSGLLLLGRGKGRESLWHDAGREGMGEAAA